MIKTGKLPITALTLVAILSLSVGVNLPGLAVTPMLGTLSEIFPHTTQLEKQLLTVLPNLLIIPFVLLSGKLSLSKHKIATVIGALVVYLAAGVAYFFCESMTALIVVSCVLGCGAGLLIPFSTGLLADTFAGPARMKMMGWQSGISNLMLVAATYLVGWLSRGNWHAPFAVYLVPLIPIVLSFGLKGIPASELTPPAAAAADEKPAPGTHDGFYMGKLWGVVGVYAFITFSTIVVSYYCPFLVEKRHWSASLSGAVTACYFMLIFVCGFALPWLVRRFRSYTFVVGAAAMAGGLAMFAFIPSGWAMCVGAAVCGFGYGMCQPILYDKASLTVSSDSKATLALAIVLSSNYLAIVLTPFIIDACRTLFHAGGVPTFAFILNFALTVVYLGVAIWKRRSFALGVGEAYYAPDPHKG